MDHLAITGLIDRIRNRGTTQEKMTEGIAQWLQSAMTEMLRTMKGNELWRP